MPRKQSRFDGSVAEWLEVEGIVEAAPSGPGDIADVATVRGLLIAVAREGRAASYSEMLGALGFRFTRPKMRALCKTLDAIDADATAAGEPELAVLVVRESDRLPGQGWWTGAAQRYGYTGDWTGAEAKALVTRVQQVAFDHWQRDRA